jgi:hypothetical protein
MLKDFLSDKLSIMPNPIIYGGCDGWFFFLQINGISEFEPSHGVNESSESTVG